MPEPPHTIPQIAPREKIVHALNRLAFGPGPGDVETVKRTGVTAWIEQQLHPETIAENPVLETKLAMLDTLNMDASDMVRRYPPPPLIKAMVDGRAPFPQDPETRYMIEPLVERYSREKQGAGNGPTEPVKFESAASRLTENQKRIFASPNAPAKAELLDAMPLEQQYELLSAMPAGARQKIYAAASPQVRRRIQKFAGPQQVVNQDLAEGKLLWAVYSNRQLEEVLTDFWFNHFNVYLDKGADRYLVTSYERDVIRPHVLGRFEDLLLATAQSPAMLFYLDNWQSTGADAPVNRNGARNSKKRRGLNENYGRELMELHTLGVDGGYTQRDVTEVARCFTGWTIREPRLGGGFQFNPRLHDQGEKTVLGIRIPAGGGMDDGLKVLDILAHHPSTARFISRSLATRFVSDDPPPTLIDRMAQRFLATHGDLREVMRTMFAAPEFWSTSAYRAKVKSPFEMVASALRATNADIDFGYALIGQLNTMGEPPYRKQEPTGYSNRGEAWLNSAALLGRMNFAIALAENKLPGVRVNPPKTPAGGDPAALAHVYLNIDLSEQTRDAIARNLAERSSPAEPSPGKQALVKIDPQALAAGLALGSPEFQRR